MKRQTLILILMICQRDLVEIVSVSIFKFQDSKMPNPLTANTAFAALNYPSIAIYMVAYILSIKDIIYGPKKKKKKSVTATDASESLRQASFILAVGGEQRQASGTILETEDDETNESLIKEELNKLLLKTGGKSSASNQGKSASSQYSLNSDGARHYSGTHRLQAQFERQMMSQREPNEITAIGGGKQSFKLSGMLSFQEKHPMLASNTARFSVDPQ